MWKVEEGEPNNFVGLSSWYFTYPEATQTPWLTVYNGNLLFPLQVKNFFK